MKDLRNTFIGKIRTMFNSYFFYLLIVFALQITIEGKNTSSNGTVGESRLWVTVALENSYRVISNLIVLKDHIRNMIFLRFTSMLTIMRYPTDMNAKPTMIAQPTVWDNGLSSLLWNITIIL